MTTLTTVPFVLFQEINYLKVGYGDMVPQTNIEKILSIIIMILGIAFFSYIMGNFTDVLSSYEKKLGEGNKSSELQKWITSLSNYRLLDYLKSL